MSTVENAIYTELKRQLGENVTEEFRDRVLGSGWVRIGGLLVDLRLLAGAAHVASIDDVMAKFKNAVAGDFTVTVSPR